MALLLSEKSLAAARRLQHKARILQIAHDRHVGRRTEQVWN
jgi:hypothetical protein